MKYLRLLTVEGVADKTGYATGTVRGLMRQDPSFPRSVRVRGRRVYWIETEVTAWARQKGRDRASRRAALLRECAAFDRRVRKEMKAKEAEHSDSVTMP